MLGLGADPAPLVQFVVVIGLSRSRLACRDA